MNLDVKKIVDLSLPVLEGFKRVEPRPWDIPAIILELQTELGSLGRAITILENYRHGMISQHRIGDELSDVVFVLVRLAVEIGCDLPEEIDSVSADICPVKTYSLLVSRVSSCDWENIDIRTAESEISQLLHHTAALARYYQIPLISVHAEEMYSASCWQKLSFRTDGSKRSHFVRFFSRYVFAMIENGHRGRVNRLPRSDMLN